jgi:hypothetical protein
MWGKMGGHGIKWADGPNTPRPSIYSIEMVRLRRFGRMYFDLPFCVKSVKRVKRVKENVGNPLRTIGYAFK